MGRPLLTLLLLTLSACAEPPGEPVGTYRLTYALQDNACGEGAVYSLDGRRFDVELRQESGRGWWRPADGAPVIGSYDEGRFRFSFEKLIQLIPPGPARSAPGCFVLQSELLTGEVTDEGLSGSHDIVLAPTADSACEPATLAGGGPFVTLPCELAYTYEGEPRASF